LSQAAGPGLQLLARDVFDFVVRLEIFEIAVAITFGNTRASQRTLGAVARGAIARNGPHHFRFTGGRACARCLSRCKRLRTFRRSLDNSPAAALANRTICSRHVESLTIAAANSNWMEDCAKCGTCGISGRKQFATEILQLRPAPAKLRRGRKIARGPTQEDDAYRIVTFRCGWRGAVRCER
jgi:hypothetical protein